MTRTLALAALAAAALVLPGTALAKEIESVQVCGASGCRTETDTAALRVLEGSAGESDTYVGPPAASAFHTVRVTVRAGEERVTWQSHLVLAARVMRTTDEANRAAWRRLPAKEQAAWEGLTRGVEPFARPTLTRVTVAGKAVVDPNSYLALYDIRRRGLVRPGKADWVTIRLRSAQPSPWTDGTNELSYSRSANLLTRDGELVRVPGALASRLERRASLRLPSSKPRSTLLHALGSALGLL
jgi:hypothetical protein